MSILERLRDKLSGTDALVRAMRGANRSRFVEVFGRSTVLFLQIPPGCEDGLDPNMSQEEFLSHVRAHAPDVSQREQFTPFCRIRSGRQSLLLFTAQNLVQEFAHAYVRRVKRIMPFEVLGVQGRIATGLFSSADSVVFNAATKHEYELPLDDILMLKTSFPVT